MAIKNVVSPLGFGPVAYLVTQGFGNYGGSSGPGSAGFKASLRRRRIAALFGMLALLIVH